MTDEGTVSIDLTEKGNRGGRSAVCSMQKVLTKALRNCTNKKDKIVRLDKISINVYRYIKNTK